MKRAAAIVCWGIFVLTAAADQPVPPPKDHTVKSSNGRFAAVITVRPPQTTAYAISGFRRQKLWSMPGYQRLAYLADDGQHLVVGYVGANLIPTNYTRDLVMLSFFHQGKLIREVPLREIIPDLSKLERTVSHFYWGMFTGFAKDGFFYLETVDQRRLKYNACTGRLRATARIKTR